MKLKTSDVPQADSLALVRRLLQAVADKPDAAVKQWAEITGFSERHVRYRLQAARVLGFLQDGNETVLNARAKRLLATSPASPEEKKQLVAAVNACEVIQQIAPNFLDSEQLDTKKLADRIARLSGLSLATAERRAGGLRSWHRSLR